MLQTGEISVGAMTAAMAVMAIGFLAAVVISGYNRWRFKRDVKAFDAIMDAKIISKRRGTGDGGQG